MAILISKIIYILFPVFLSYFLIVMFYYLFLALVGLAEGKRRTRESEMEDYRLFYISTLTIPVSIIIPARNEEEWIQDSLLSVLNLNYPEFEIVIVDDGSTDKTFEILDAVLELRSLDSYYVRHYQDGRVREIFKSEKYSKVTVICKTSGRKKAGAVNAGLNIAKYKYVCVIDADTILEPDALLKVMTHVQKDPDGVIGIGSYYGLSNGFKIKDGKIIERSFSYNPIIAYQNLEYIRSFIGSRIAWSRFNSTPIIAGSFAIWRRDVLYKLGGYSSDFTCEDLEFTFRVHDYIVQNKEKGYKMLMLPYSAAWTEGPSNIFSLILQRNRWQRVTNETAWRYKYMIFNPKYSAFAFLTLPYFVLYEVLGVFFEISSIAMTTAGWVTGILDVKVFLTFFLFMVLSQGIASLLSLFVFIRDQKMFRLRYITYLVALSFFEFFLYRWLISIAKILGSYGFLRKVRIFDQYPREKRIKI